MSKWEYYDPDGEIGKRLTMNLLIQGAACHTMLTSHHIVKDELEFLEPGLVQFYDKCSIVLYLTQWMGQEFFLFKWPSLFWRNVGKPKSPFCKHRFLVAHGRTLAKSSFQHAKKRAKQQRVWSILPFHVFEAIYYMFRSYKKEKPIRKELDELAVKIVSEIWGIDASRLSASITFSPMFGNVRQANTWYGRQLASGAVGWGGVENHEGELSVVGKAWFWPLVVHELTKGVAELVGLHGLNHMSEGDYRRVVDAADHIEFEIWMMQAGPDLYRRLLAALPSGMNIATGLMLVANMSPDDVESLMFDLVEAPHVATVRLRQLGHAL